MRAVRIHGRGGPDHLVFEDAPPPEPNAGEALVRVEASGVIANELTWDLTYQQPDGSPRPYPIPGRDVSGTVVRLGHGVNDLDVGDAVYGLLAFGRDGADAEYAIGLPSELAPKPQALTHAQAAAVPLAALTAWQALFVRADLSSGQTVLIHGAAGGVGSFAVQFAHWVGARVITTASGANTDFLRDLGADQCIDYATTRFEDVVRNVDVVFDTVGHDTLARSWQVVKRGGVLVSVVSPPPDESARAPEVRFIWFIVEPSAAQLREISALLNTAQIRPVVAREFSLAEARRAYEEASQGHARGKIVITVG
jgi:NADPH:quinone reductase-like Zn-dependent oxidoreductase